MAENAHERLSGVLDVIAAKGLPDVDIDRYFEKNLGKGLKQEDLEANLKLAKCICALHTEIFGEDDHITIAYQKDSDGEAIGFMEEVDFGRKGFRLTVPNSAKKLEAYGRDCIKMYGLEKEYPFGFLDVGILMFACHLIRQYCQATILKKRFDWKTNSAMISFADKELSHRISQAREAIADEFLIKDREAALRLPFQFDGRVVQMAILEILAKKGTARDVVNALVSEPPTISDLISKLILG